MERTHFRSKRWTDNELQEHRHSKDYRVDGDDQLFHENFHSDGGVSHVRRERQPTQGVRSGSSLENTPGYHSVSPEPTYLSTKTFAEFNAILPTGADNVEAAQRVLGVKADVSAATPARGLHRPLGDNILGNSNIQEALRRFLKTRDWYTPLLERFPESLQASLRGFVVEIDRNPYFTVEKKQAALQQILSLYSGLVSRQRPASRP